MTTKAYYTKEVVKGFIARIMNEAVKLGITFSQGCQIHPSRLDASAESMTKLMNWICYARVVDHKDGVPDAKAYAAKAVEHLIKNPTRKFKLNAEWRQFSWWALSLRFFRLFAGKICFAGCNVFRQHLLQLRDFAGVVQATHRDRAKVGSGQLLNELL